VLSTACHEPTDRRGRLLRKGSYNLKLAIALARIDPSELALDVVSLDAVPTFTQFPWTFARFAVPLGA